MMRWCWSLFPVAHRWKTSLRCAHDALVPQLESLPAVAAVRLRGMRDFMNCASGPMPRGWPQRNLLQY
jgi:hypothetical protein